MTDNGLACATTPSMRNLQELMEIVVRFDNRLEFDNKIIGSFHMENGEEVLSDYYRVDGVYIYQNDVIIKFGDPLMLYLASIYEGEQLDIYIRGFSEFRSYLESIIKTTGEIRITNKAVLFRFKKK